MHTVRQGAPDQRPQRRQLRGKDLRVRLLPCPAATTTAATTASAAAAAATVPAAASTAAAAAHAADPDSDDWPASSAADDAAVRGLHGRQEQEDVGRRGVGQPDDLQRGQEEEVEEP